MKSVIISLLDDEIREALGYPYQGIFVEIVLMISFKLKSILYILFGIPLYDYQDYFSHKRTPLYEGEKPR